jgi:hypothetical protein
MQFPDDRVARFNEVAAVMLRKAQIRMDRIARRSSFNEVAAVMLRKAAASQVALRLWILALFARASCIAAGCADGTLSFGFTMSNNRLKSGRFPDRERFGIFSDDRSARSGRRRSAVAGSIIAYKIDPVSKSVCAHFILRAIPHCSGGAGQTQAPEFRK